MRLKEIAEFLSLEYEGEDIEITALNSLLRANFTELTYCDGERNIKDINKRFSYGEKFQPLSGMNIKGGKALIPIEKYLAKPVQGFFDSNIGLNEA